MGVHQSRKNHALAQIEDFAGEMRPHLGPLPHRRNLTALDHHRTILNRGAVQRQ